MDIISVSKHPVGVNINVLVNFDSRLGDHLFGVECQFGTRVAIPHEGVQGEGLMTLYNVKRSGRKVQDAEMLTPDPGFPPKNIRRLIFVILDSSMTFVVAWGVFLLPWIFCIRPVDSLAALFPPSISVLLLCLRTG